MKKLLGIIFFLLIFFYANHLKAEPGYFCIWTGSGEYTDKKWFSHSLDNNNNFKKNFWGVGKDCRQRSLYVVTHGQNKKLYKKLLSKFKITDSFHPVKKLNKKLFALVAEQTPKYIIELKEEVKETIKEPKSKTTSSTTITKKKAKKPKEKKTVFPEVSPKLKLIEDMYKSGALTKDEYDAAKKRATE
jgi:hypothetical protein|tara:strand:- start:181 stop:744 length:564 start_codon:yes stop_codon:yes gene_type:complete